ncbi:hypothetical protein SAMN05443252_102497 [Bacillus sp. OV322]|nr:hypothetical protein SAMN05443252_102497 [Bacillus sp. OV322]
MDSFRKIHKKVEQDNMKHTDQALKKAEDDAKQAMILIGALFQDPCCLPCCSHCT